MKRIFFGILWFFAFGFGGITIGSGIAGGVAGSTIQATTPEARRQAADVGAFAGYQFGRNYAGFMFLGALVISIVGTATGVLPGTKSRKKQNDD